MPVLVIGGGLAGLVTATMLVELGRDALVIDNGDEAGGTSVWSTGWIWRYRAREAFATYAPGGDRVVQHAIWNELPAALTWLKSVTGPFVAAASQNPLTEGTQADMRRVCATLADWLGTRLVTGEAITALAGTSDGWRVETSTGRVFSVSSLVFAGGGYGANLARIAGESGASDRARSWWQRRNAGGSLGTTIDLAASLGGAETRRMGECYMRAAPLGAGSADGSELSLARAAELAQVYAQHAVLSDDTGRGVQQPAHDFSDTQVVNALAHRTGRGWLLVGPAALSLATPHGSVGDLIAAAEQAGSPVLRASATDLVARLTDAGLDLSLDAEVREAARSAACAVPVVPGITHTMGGIMVDAFARVRARDSREGAVIPRLYAAGVDVGGVANGGYASGLAQALTLGRIAARTIVSDIPRSRERG